MEVIKDQSPNKRKPRVTRMTKEHKLYFIHVIYRKLLLRINPEEIWNFFLSEDMVPAFLWSRRTYDNLYAQARKQLKARKEIIVDLELDKAIKQLEELFYTAWEKGDLKTALMVRREWSETLGLKQDRVVVYQDLTEKEIHKELRELGLGPKLDKLLQNKPPEQKNILQKGAKMDIDEIIEGAVSG
jgi:hypothetical protein